MLSPASQADLLKWFRSRARDLPWRSQRTPYRVWISEIMLQQTQVATVLPYYQRFLATFPDAQSLAAASEDQVMAHWAGLGYYSRARNLIACAREQVARYGGELPASADELRALPGFGPYTTAAVGSLAFGLPLAVLDGNVIRVLARLVALEEDVGRPAVRGKLQALAQAALDAEHPGEWNEAMMELGATLCKPRAPKCDSCPLRADCRAAALDAVLRFPVKEMKAIAPSRPTVLLLLTDSQGRLLARRRGDEGMLRGLWELPSAQADAPCPPGQLESCWEDLFDQLAQRLEVLGPLDLARGSEGEGQLELRFTHTYSHFKAQILARRARLKSPGSAMEAWCWLQPDQVKELGFSSRDRRVLETWPVNTRA